MPQEFTKVDGIIDLVFSATKEIKPEEIEEAEEDDGERSGKKFTFVPVQFRDARIARLQLSLGESLVRQTAAIYATPDGGTGVLCAISKEYHRYNRTGYWFAFHPSQQTALLKYAKAWIAFGCGSENQIILCCWHRYLGVTVGENSRNENLCTPGRAVGILEGGTDPGKKHRD
jgi:hypothetical protein